MVDEWVVLVLEVVFLVVVVWRVELVGMVVFLVVVLMLLCVVELLVSSAFVDMTKSRLTSQQVRKSIVMSREYSKTMRVYDEVVETRPKTSHSFSYVGDRAKRTSEIDYIHSTRKQKNCKNSSDAFIQNS